MIKFNRSYNLRVRVDAAGTDIVIEPPFTLQLDITRRTFGSNNLAQLRIINLSEFNRNQIRFNFTNTGVYRPIELRAGYGDNLPLVFFGNMTQAWSVRERTDFITQIECFDAGYGFLQGNIDKQFAPRTPQRDIFAAMIAGMPEVKVGAIGDFGESSSRESVYSGNPASMLSELSGGAFFVDKGVGHVLKPNEYIKIGSGPAVVISPSSGLLGTPVLEQTILRVTMLFEPMLNVGNLVRLQAFSNRNFNGDYVCTAVKHRGTISESVSGELITEAEFFYTKQLIGVTPGV